jgi:hypothetical protein
MGGVGSNLVHLVVSCGYPDLLRLALYIMPGDPSHYPIRFVYGLAGSIGRAQCLGVDLAVLPLDLTRRILGISSRQVESPADWPLCGIATHETGVQGWLG